MFVLFIIFEFQKLYLFTRSHINVIVLVEVIMNRCECGSTNVERIIKDRYNYIESGLTHSFLLNAEVYHCNDCSSESGAVMPKLSKVNRLLVRALLLKPYILSGEEATFLRKYVALNAETFSKISGVEIQMVENWANNDRVILYPCHDRIVRLLILDIDGETSLQLDRSEFIRKVMPDILNNFHKYDFEVEVDLKPLYEEIDSNRKTNSDDKKDWRM